MNADEVLVVYAFHKGLTVPYSQAVPKWIIRKLVGINILLPPFTIPTDMVAGLRDRALIGTMLYTFGRVGAVIEMDVEDYRLSNHQRTLLLHEKGSKEH